MIRRRWKLLILGAISVAAIAAMLVPSSRNSILGGFLHRAESRSTQTAFFASEGGPQRPPDIKMPPDKDGSHTGEIWKDPSGGELHGGPGHTGVDCPYHVHPPDPSNPGHRLPGPGIPVDENGSPINSGDNTGNTGRTSMAIPRDNRNGRLIYPLPDPEPNLGIISDPIPPPVRARPITSASSAAEPGGILLSPTARANLGNLKGAVYDPETHSLVVVGAARQQLPAISEDEWAALLKCALDGTDPAFSLDPADSSNPLGPHLRCRYVPETLRNSSVGRSLFICDVRMKRDTLGLDDPGVQGFQNMFRLGFARGGRQSGRLCRMWNEAQRVKIRRSGNAIVFDDLVMRVKTEKMIASRLGIESTGEADPDALWVANFLSAHYAELPGEYQKVKQLAAAYALAKFIVDRGVDIDRNWLEEALGSVRNPDIVDAAHVTREKRTVARRRVPGGARVETTVARITIHGGIQLCVVLPRDTNDPAARHLASCVVRRLGSERRITRFTLADGSVAAVIPIPG